jgi:hypothetical protein
VNKRTSLWVGMGLIVLGVLALMGSLAMPVVGPRMLRWGLQRIWPAIVVNIGLAFIAIPLLVRKRRGLGGMMIPGVPILTTGLLLFVASVTGWWRIWSYLWPFEVLGVAGGLLAAAIYMRVIWLIIPAFIIGANGLLMQFCAITGLWNAWAVMWTIEPLSVGLAFLIIGARKRITPLMSVGLGLCGGAGLAALGMMAVVPLRAVSSSWWLIKMAVPVLILGCGALLVVWGLAGRELPQPKAAQPDPQPEADLFAGTTPELHMR